MMTFASFFISKRINLLLLTLHGSLFSITDFFVTKNGIPITADTDQLEEVIILLTKKAKESTKAPTNPD